VELGADVVLLSPHLRNYEPELIGRLYHFAERPIIVIGLVPADGDWARSMEQAQAQGHLLTPLSPSDMQRLATLAHGGLRKALQYRSSDSYVPRISPATAKIVDRGGWQRQTVVFWSPSGGVGKTTLAVNTALCLGAIAGKRTLLIDADMNKADCHIHLGMLESTPHNIYGLARQYHSLRGMDRRAENPRPRDMPIPMLENNVLRYHDSQLRILRGIPETYLASEEVFDGTAGLEYGHALLDAATQAFDFVVIDCGQSYNHLMHLVVLERAQAVYLVVNSTTTTLLNAKKAMLTATKKTAEQRVYVDPDQVRLVMNKFDPAHGLTRGGVHAFLGMPVFAEVPMGEDGEVELSLNTAQPMVLHKKRSLVSQAIMQLTGTLYPPLEDVRRLALGKGRRGLLEKLLGTPG